MAKVQHEAGYFEGGMPYNKFGSGARTMVIFQGLMFVNKPMPSFLIGQFSKMYGALEKEYTVYIVNRKPGLFEGSTMKDISESYAEMIREEFEGPVDVMGVSTGGSIVQHFAADHPELVGKLVLHSAAHTLSEKAKRGQMLVAWMARQKKWRKAYSALMSVSLPERGIKRIMLKPFYGFMALFGGAFFGKPKEHPFDVAITIEAEDKHAFKERLHEIAAPTLVIAGEKDPFYSPELFRETAEGIPNSKLIIYEGMGHPAMGDEFKKELAEFLRG